jgi:hypothetical protein
MHGQDWNIVLLGAASTATCGSTIGFAESELGLGLYPGLHED